MFYFLMAILIYVATVAVSAMLAVAVGAVAGTIAGIAYTGALFYQVVKKIKEGEQNQAIALYIGGFSIIVPLFYGILEAPRFTGIPNAFIQILGNLRVTDRIGVNVVAICGIIMITWGIWGGKKVANYFERLIKLDSPSNEELYFPTVFISLWGWTIGGPFLGMILGGIPKELL